MLHIKRVAQALKGNATRQIRILSGLKSRPRAPVLVQSLENIVDRHGKLCALLQSLIPRDFSMDGKIACEVGPGDCLANAALMLGLGASHVDLIEMQPAVVNAKQIQALETIRETKIPISMEIVDKEKLVLNADKVSYQQSYMENYVANDRYDFVCSFNVGEHVEDLDGFFASCYRATRPGGINAHMIDLGGHGQFEDPLPPLDFQTYPDWLYGMMFPPYHRATRRFCNEHADACRKAGFELLEVVKLRTADSGYLKAIRPILRKAAQERDDDELSVIEFALIARKPG
ncbi:MAG: methyltransferase domain-containing protein [Chthoniobacteraceae bacterium]